MEEGEGGGPFIEEQVQNTHILLKTQSIGKDLVVFLRSEMRIGYPRIPFGMDEIPGIMIHIYLCK